MGYKEIIDRANERKRVFDHICWEGHCTRCGINNKIWGEELFEEYRNAYITPDTKDIRCKAPNCLGRIKWYGRMPAKRAIHLSDIKRR